MTLNPIDIFISEVIRAEHLTLAQVAAHEAGHKMFWNVTFPDIPVKYAVSGGLPAVIPSSGGQPLKLADMDNREASRYVYIKLGGIAAEIIMFNLHPAVDLIADFVTTDFYGGESGLDWQDDQEHGGDIPAAIRIIESRAGQQSVKVNFTAILHSCVDNLLANLAEFEAEKAKALNLFRQWHDRGMFRL